MSGKIFQDYGIVIILIIFIGIYYLFVGRKKKPIAGDAYSAEVYCSNCKYKKEIEVQKGTLVTDMKCPNCNCETLDKYYGDEDNV